MKTVLLSKFVLIIPFVFSSCSDPIEARLKELTPEKNYSFIYNQVDKNVCYQNQENKYSILEYYRNYFDNNGITTIDDDCYVVDNRFYNFAFNYSNNNYSFLVSSFDLIEKSIKPICEFSENELIRLFPGLKKYKNYQISVGQGYHDYNYIDYIVKCSDNSFTICELEFIYDLSTLEEVYKGEVYPNTYNPDNDVLKSTGAIIKVDGDSKQYLEINKDVYYFDADYLDSNCEQYKNIKRNIYPDIDDFSHQLFRHNSKFYLRIARIHNDKHDISFDNNKASKGIVFEINLESKKLNYCGYIEENSFLISTFYND